MMIPIKNSFDVITFGSATRDINLRSKNFTVSKDDGNKNFVTGEGICLALGSKVPIEELRYTSGGGGTNVAATFAKQGLKTAYCGAIGTDEAGLELVKEMKGMGIDLKFLKKVKEKMTNHSVVIASGSDDRIILTYRGAAEMMDYASLPLKKMHAQWLYLAPLTGLLCDNFGALVDFAKASGIRVAVNPSNQQLSLPEADLRRIFQKVDVLILNQEEASFLTKVSFKDEAALFRALDGFCPGIVVMTKGVEGVSVSDGKHLYSAKPNADRVIVDTTGAGDAFASGFLAEYIKTGGDIEKAVQLGMGNSEANLRHVGAKTGILEKDEAFTRVPVTKTACDNAVCIIK